MVMTRLKKVFLILFAVIITNNITFSEDLVNPEQLKKNNAAIKELEKLEQADFYQTRAAFSVQWDSLPQEMHRGYKQFKRWEHFWEARVYPSGRIPEPMEIYKGVKNFKEAEYIDVEKSGDSPLSQNLEWKLLGPIITPETTPAVRHQGIGRVNVIRFHPTNANELWAGSASGGVWKSTDGGKSWKVFPFTNFLSLGVSDIAVSQSHPHTVYVATGDAVGSLSITMPYYSIGLIKTTNSGETWDYTGMAFELESGNQITRVLIHPKNPNIVIIATSKGIYRSSDGGKLWEASETGTYFKDMQFHPTDPEIMYASTFSFGGKAGIYRSTNNGRNWQFVKEFSDVIRIALATTRKNSNYVYALCALVDTKSFHSVQISTDMGITWEDVTTGNNTPNLLGRYRGTGGDAQVGQGWYDLCISVDPNNTNIIHVGGINIWKSTNFGSVWDMNAHWLGMYSRPYVHADIHNLEYQNHSQKLFSAHDGGIDYTTNSGTTWTYIADGMSITQFYSMDVSQSGTEFIVAGSQDNGTSRYENGSWLHVAAGDGMICAIDPSNPRYVYSSNPNGSFYRSSDYGKNFDGPIISAYSIQESGAWLTPFAIDPNDGRNLYTGYANIYKSTDRGNSWQKMSNFGSGNSFRFIKVAPSDSKTIYASTVSSLYVSYDGGLTWKALYASGNAITSIEVDPNNARRIWVTHSGYNIQNKVYEYVNETPRNISGNLPNIPINTIVYQKDSPDRLYIGTDAGVYYSDYGSGFWASYGQNLPNVIVSDLKIRSISKKLIAGTYGRGVWEIPVLECNLPQPELNYNGPTEICAGDSVIFTAPDGYSNYFWSNGEKGKTIVIKKSGLYSLVVDDGMGCNAKSKAIDIKVFNVPELQISPSGGGFLCEDGELTLSTGFGFVDYDWSTGDKTRNIKINKPGNYSLTATTSDGCKSYSEILIEQKENPDKPAIWQIGGLLTTIEASGYQWYFDSKKIFGATSQTFSINKLGPYSVFVFNEFGCSTESEQYEVVSNIEEYQRHHNDLFIFPNPSEGLFNIVSDNLKSRNSIINVRDMLGRQIISIRSNGDSTAIIDLSNYPSGTYLVVINRDGVMSFARILKK